MEKRVKVLYSLGMGRLCLFILAIWVVSGVFSPDLAFTGDEDTKQVTPKAPPVEPEPMPLPEEEDSPDMSLGGDEVLSPEFSEPELENDAPPVPARRRGSRAPFDPDKNLDYSELLSLAEPIASSRGVLPPALGTRGYRPNLVAVSAGDRTPGYGAFVEYSWNRLGIGAFFAYRPLKDVDRYNIYQTIGGAYGIYRWLPWDFSPYLLAGLELGSKTPDFFGGLVGIGMEGRIYSGWTALLGYSFHSTVRKGFWGGAIGWSF